MKTWKRALALVLALVMALSLVALPSFAEGEETGDGTAATQPVWPAEGSIKLDKDAKAVKGQENLWELTLTIEGKNYSTTSDVVLVIDNSNSMYYKNGKDDRDGYGNATTAPRMKNTIAAAKAFADKLLTENSTTHIALVVYGTNVHWSTDFYDAAHKSDLTQKLGEISQDYNNGGTNQQAGIHKAQELLEASTGKQKNIVILSDGEPTYSHPFVATATYEGCSRRYDWGCGDFGPTGGRITNIGAFTPDYNDVIGKGNKFTMDYNAVVTATCPKHGGSTAEDYVYALDGTVTQTSGTNNGVATIWEANQAKAAGTTIFSVALQAGTEGENTLKSCATDAAKGYFSIGRNDDVEQKLTSAFEAIAGSIAIAASNGSVADTMGKEVQLSFSGAAPVITTDKAVYDAGEADVYISQGSATYDTTNRRINWTVGNVREGDNPIMKYKVTVKEGCNPSTGEVLDANESATFSYKNYLGKDTVGTFPVPQVTVGGGNILVHYYLVNDQGQPINENGAVVESPALAKQVKPAAYHEEKGSTGLSYNIPYTVSHDNVANYNYFGSYILNDSNLTKGDSVDVTLTAANSNQHVWFAYY